MEIKVLCQTPSKAFDMSSATAKDLPKCLRAEDQESEKRERKFTVYWRSEIRLVELRCFLTFLLTTDSKTLDTMEVKENKKAVVPSENTKEGKKEEAKLELRFTAKCQKG